MGNIECSLLQNLSSCQSMIVQGLLVLYTLKRRVPPCWVIVINSHQSFPLPQAFIILHPASTCLYLFYEIITMFLSFSIAEVPVSISGVVPPPCHLDGFINLASCSHLPSSSWIQIPGFQSQPPSSAVPFLWCITLSSTTQLIQDQVCFHCSLFYFVFLVA